jgi:integrase
MAIEQIREHADGRMFLKDRDGKTREISKADGMHCDGDGLYLQVSRGGTARSWIFRFQLAGAPERSMGLGSFNTYTLKDARELAVACRKERDRGIDPIVARKERLEAARRERERNEAFIPVAEAWLLKEEAGCVRSTAETRRNQLVKYVFPYADGLLMRQVDVNWVCKVLEPIWTKMPPTAEGVRQSLEGIIRYACAKGYIGKSDIASLDDDKPLRELLPDPDHTNHEVEHHKPWPWPTIGLFVAKVRSRTDQTGLHQVNAYRDRPSVARAPQRSITSEAVEFLTLTGVRKEQVAEAKWDEFDRDHGIWDCQHHKTEKKTKRAYMVVLSTQARDVLDRMPEQAKSKTRCVVAGDRP